MSQKFAREQIQHNLEISLQKVGYNISIAKHANSDKGKNCPTFFKNIKNQLRNNVANTVNMGTNTDTTIFSDILLKEIRNTPSSQTHKAKKNLYLQMKQRRYNQLAMDLRNLAALS